MSSSWCLEYLDELDSCIVPLWRIKYLQKEEPKPKEEGLDHVLIRKVVFDFFVMSVALMLISLIVEYLRWKWKRNEVKYSPTPRTEWLVEYMDQQAQMSRQLIDQSIDHERLLKTIQNLVIEDERFIKTISRKE